MFIVRRKDPSAYQGAETPGWQTVARRPTREEAERAMRMLKAITKKPGVHWWVGEELDPLQSGDPSAI